MIVSALTPRQVTTRRIAARDPEPPGEDVDDAAWTPEDMMVPSFQRMDVAAAAPSRPKPITMALISKRCLTPQQTAGKGAEEVMEIARVCRPRAAGHFLVTAAVVGATDFDAVESRLLSCCWASLTSPWTARS